MSIWQNNSIRFLPGAFEQVYSIRHKLFLWSIPKTNSESSGYPHNIHATVTPVGISCLAAWCCKSLQPGKNADDLFPSTTYIDPSGIVKANRKEASSSILRWFLSICYSPSMPSVTVPYHLFLMVNQEEWQEFVLFYGPLGLLYSITHKELLYLALRFFLIHSFQ